MLNIDKDALAALFTSKYTDPYTRQEYFGGVTGAEIEVINGMEKDTIIAGPKDLGASWFLQELRKELIVVRLNPIRANQDMAHVVTGVLETRAQTQCPLTSKKSSATFKYYVTKKMMDEIKKLAK